MAAITSWSPLVVTALITFYRDGNRSYIENIRHEYKYLQWCREVALRKKLGRQTCQAKREQGTRQGWRSACLALRTRSFWRCTRVGGWDDQNSSFHLPHQLGTPLPPAPESAISALHRWDSNLRLWSWRMDRSQVLPFECLSDLCTLLAVPRRILSIETVLWAFLALLFLLWSTRRKGRFRRPRVLVAQSRWLGHILALLRGSHLGLSRFHTRKRRRSVHLELPHLREKQVWCCPWELESLWWLPWTTAQYDPSHPRCQGQPLRDPWSFATGSSYQLLSSRLPSSTWISTGRQAWLGSRPCSRSRGRAISPRSQYCAGRIWNTAYPRIKSRFLAQTVHSRPMS